MPKGAPRIYRVNSDPPKNNQAGEQKPPGLSSVLGAFQLHRPALHRFIARFLFNRQDVEDVAQEAFLRAFSAEKNTEIDQPKSYLFRVAKNLAVSQLRLKSRQITSYLDDEDTSDNLASGWTLDDEMMARQKLGIHCEAVASLPPQCRKVYLLRKVHGLRHKAIAERLGIAISTVEKHLNRGVELCDLYINERMSDGDQKGEGTVTHIHSKTTQGGAK